MGHLGRRCILCLFVQPSDAVTTCPDGGEVEENEWWIKSSRQIGGAEGEYDFPPHVVRVHSVSEPVEIEDLSGDLVLRESPWDPYTELLPLMRE